MKDSDPARQAPARGPEAGGERTRAAPPDGRRAGRPLRELAVDLYGAARVDAEWTADGWMRARLRRMLHRAADGTAPLRGPGPG